MKQTKLIKSINSNLFSKDVKLPIIGLVKLDAKGVVEVPEEVAKLLVNNSPKWELVEQLVVSEEEEEEEEGQTEEDDEEDGMTIEQFTKHIDGLNKKQLEEFAINQMGLDKKEVLAQKGKKELKDFMIAKASE